jgi:predicted TIM-barrel fold metal-dependent hydrolase
MPGVSLVHERDAVLPERHRLPSIGQHEHVFEHVFFLRRVVEYEAALLEHAPGTDVVVDHVGVQRPVEVDVEERAQGRGGVAVPQ